MIKTPSILITGATGTIGLELLKQFQELGHLKRVSAFARKSKKNEKLLHQFSDELTVYWGDILEEEALIPACTGKDMIIHLAGLIPPAFDENSTLGRRINLDGTKRLINVLEQYNPSAFLLFSSSITVYGDRLINYEIRKTDELERDQHHLYGRTKIETEDLIQQSSLDWSIFRLTAIMGTGNHKISPIMFHVPLATKMEIATVKDTAAAFLNATNHRDELRNTVFNLGGGEEARITYGEFLERSFHAFGLGKPTFPKHAFAFHNFHCGHYMDGDELEVILKFRTDTLESFFQRFNNSVPTIQRLFTRPFAWFIKRYLLSISEPYKAYKTNNIEEIEIFFGSKSIDS